MVKLDRFNVEIEGLDSGIYRKYDEFSTRALYYNINLYDLLEDPVIKDDISEYVGFSISCSYQSYNDLYDNYSDKIEIEPDFLKMNKLIIPEHIKYLELYLELERYNNLEINHNLEYVKLHLSICDIYSNYNILNNFMKKVDTVKSLSIILDYDARRFFNKRQDSRYPQISTYDMEDDLEMQSNVIKLVNEILPRQLEWLHVNFIITNLNEFTNLRVFNISTDGDGSYKAPLDDLPASLEWLEIHAHDFNYPINNLPNNLKVLIFNQFRIFSYANGYRHSLNYLPLSLRVLVMPETDMMDETPLEEICNNLPPLLQYLSVPDYVSNLDWNAIPDSVEVLEAPMLIPQIKKNKVRLHKLPGALREFKVDRGYGNKEKVPHLEILKGLIESGNA